MKTKFLFISLAFIFFSLNEGYAQVTDDNNAPTVGNFVGFNGASGISLPIRNDGFPEIDISSNGSNKFAIDELPTWTGLNGLTRSRVQRTTMGLQSETNDAWSMLHLWSGTLPIGMYRNWFNVGTSYTGNQDFMYSGLLERPNTGGSNLATDAVIAWGCQPGTSQNGNTDNFRFLFLRSTASSPTSGSQTQQGQEMMRISPVGNIGIGDFSSNGFGLAEQPTERLDVDGGGRFRQLPPVQFPDVFITGREVDGAGDYLLTYTPFDAINLNDCRWEDINSTTVPPYSEQDIRTGWNVNNPCYRGKVSIGIENIKSAKLMVNSECNRDFVPQGIHSRVLGRLDYESPELVGVLSIARGRSNENNSDQTYFGVQALGGQAFTAQNLSAGKDNVGVYGAAGGHSYSTNTIGLYGIATSNAGTEIGLYGENTTPGANHHPLFLVGGAPVIMGAPINVSDETIKHDINPIHEATAMLNALQPKTYYLHSPENRPIAFDENLQYGLIAQEVREVLPEIVRETTVPEMTDSTGFVEGTTVDLLGVQYNALIPILIAGFNEQSGVIAEQQSIIQNQDEIIASLQETLAVQSEALNAMQAQIVEVQSQVALMQVKTNNCCTNSEGGTMAPKSDFEEQELKLDQNVPNPFSEQTRIDFELPQEAQVVLEITDQMGRPIERLIDGRMSQGAHSTTWDGSRLARGVYFYTLYSDGKLVTKKMIKN